MSVHKNKVTGKWDAYSYYYDYTGKRKQKHKSGFEKKRDAHEWERQFDQLSRCNRKNCLNLFYVCDFWKSEDFQFAFLVLCLYWEPQNRT